MSTIKSFAYVETNTAQDWKKFFRYAWPTFKSNFMPIIDSLRRHRELLADKKMDAAIVEIQESREATESIVETLSVDLKADFKEKFEELKRAVKDRDIEREDFLLQQRAPLELKFDPPDYEADQLAASAQRHAPSSGDWILTEPRLTSWLNGAASTSGLLYLSGIPGSGKPTLPPRVHERC
jgi:hypothetical protein